MAASSGACSNRSAMNIVLELSLVPGRFAVVRLAPGAAPPDWAWKGAFSSVTRTPQELSIVCDQANVPADFQMERDLRLLRVRGPLAFSMTGVFASLAVPLAQGGISLFAVSTFDTDHLFVSNRDLAPAIAALEKAGHTIDRSESE